MKIMEKKYICTNGVVERGRFAVGNNVQPRSPKKAGNTSPRKQESNMSGAIRQAARIINCNFDSTCLMIGLDVDEPGMAYLEEHMHIKAGKAAKQSQDAKKKLPGEAMSLFATDSIDHPALKEEDIRPDEIRDGIRNAMEHEVKLWLRRLMRSADGRMRYFGVVSDKDGRTGAAVRVHAHIILRMDSVSWDLLRDKWKLGSVSISPLHHQPDYTPVAIYFLRQTNGGKDEKKYFVSRDMIKPRVEEKIIDSYAAANEIRVPPGAMVYERTEKQEGSVSQYVRYLPKKREKTTDAKTCLPNDLRDLPCSG